MLVFILEVGNFELGKTSHLFYKLITVVSTILLYHMYGRRLILFFSPPGFNIGKSTRRDICFSFHGSLSFESYG